MHESRIRLLNDRDPDPDGRYVLYWMQQSQRAAFNPALEHAVRCANRRNQGVVVVFGLTEAYPEANERHFAFMLEGLEEVATALRKRGIRLVVRAGEPDAVALSLVGDASLVVCDRGYLRHQRHWRQRVATDAGKLVVQVEGDCVVPVETASDKVEFAARTLRPKLRRVWLEFLGDVRPSRVRKSSVSLTLPRGPDVDVRDPDAVLRGLDIDRSVGRVRRFHGGTAQARVHLRRFLRTALAGYDSARNDPAQPQCSALSPYLHFGQISPVEVARKVRASESRSNADAEAFLEEMIVRRELAINFVHFHPEYDSYNCLPDWARATLLQHKNDSRPARYTRTELETGQTGDRYWNAAMREMRSTGYMHNYMRMYWGKKILEWCNTPEYAYSTALYLNNKYFLDGRDPNSYANVAWIFGLHDRPWQERSVFGKVRYMAAAGLARKFDMDAYMERVEALQRAEGE